MITLLNAVRAVPLWLRNLIIDTEERVDNLETDKYNVNQSGSTAQVITGTVNINGSVYTTGSINSRDSINADKYITGKKVGVAAYLVEPSMTAAEGGDKYTYVSGRFINVPMDGFIETANSDRQPCIEYVEPLPQWFKIDAHASFNVSENDTTVGFTIRHNDTVLDQYRMSLLCKYHDEQYCLSGTAVVQLNEGDQIQIVVNADNICDIIVYNLTTTINEFFD